MTISYSVAPNHRLAVDDNVRGSFTRRKITIAITAAGTAARHVRRLHHGLPAAAVAAVVATVPAVFVGGGARAFRR